ncbi:chemotaxis protein CheB [Pseudoxanthomonas japonensis]|uniref:Chemotaxis protein n=1 Tax=Pseudoxanthomonas japonensis TaxID=69284 RepID=A0ABQ6ZH27_9GAMM|nr:chemotaxis protein CheB [Pseudoxanthomonas japonensis]KAF1725119.1 chemotaxis protein [Pseudoxanthomonas japonensis]
MSVSEAKRVALLARPGEARERLRVALHEAGAEIVLEDDPNALDAEALGNSAPQVVLVALEPAIEDSLERFDSVLHDPAVAVIFDEAELAARRQGWDAQRWARHLAAKLHGHRDVLPPGREEDVGLQLEPGLPVTPAQLHEGDNVSDYLASVAGMALELPSDDFAYTGSFQARETDEQVIDADAWLRSASAPAETPSAPPLPETPSAVPPPLPPAAPAASGFDLSRLELEPLEGGGLASARIQGAVLVFAGIGGPDAVRKLLADLPTGFPKPVMVHLRLDGGRYDNLVRQMERVSHMPVLLAEAGKNADAGHVYVLPGDVVPFVDAGAVGFRPGAVIHTVIPQLPPTDSAVLLLSGSDTALVDAAAALGSEGALVMGQSQEGCYDPAAPKALAALGADLGSPAQIAQRLTDRWF